MHPEISNFEVDNANVHPEISVSLHSRRCEPEDHFQLVTRTSTLNFPYVRSVGDVNLKRTTTL